MEEFPLEIWLHFLRFLSDRELLEKRRCSSSWKKNIDVEMNQRSTWQTCEHTTYQWLRELIITWVPINKFLFFRFSERIGFKTIYFQPQNKTSFERKGIRFQSSFLIKKFMVEENKSIFRFIPKKKFPYRYVDYSSLPVKMYFDQKKRLKKIRSTIIENQFRISILNIDVSQREKKNVIFRIIEKTISSIMGLKAEAKVIFQFNHDFPLRFCCVNGKCDVFNWFFLVHIISRYSLAKYIEFCDNRFMLRHTLIDFIVFPF